jgi:SAM-dependent methyltransferase
VLTERPEPEEGFPSGLATMADAMRSARNYYRWIYHQIAPYLGRRVMDIGAGAGNILPFILDREAIIVVDPAPDCTEVIRGRFPERGNLHVILGNICDPSLIPSLRGLRPDTILSTNVLEHIADDRMAIRHMAEILKGQGGRLILQVPAHPSFYGSLDRAAGHFRRYDPGRTRHLFDEHGIILERLRHMNILGGIGWWFNSRILREPDLNSRSINQQIVWFDRLVVPILERVENVLRAPFGLSLIAVGRVP